MPRGNNKKAVHISDEIYNELAQYWMGPSDTWNNVLRRIIDKAKEAGLKPNFIIESKNA